MRIENQVTPPTLDVYQRARDAFTGDAMTELAVLVVDHARSARQTQRTEARAQEAQLRLMQAAQVRAMRVEAHKIKLAGMHEGAWAIGGGLATVGSGVALASAGSRDSTAAATPGAEPGTSPSTNRTPTSYDPPPASSYFAGAGKGSEGVGKLFSAHYQYQASTAREHATVADHRAREAERRVSDSQEARGHTRDLEKAAFDHLRAIQTTRTEIDRTLTNFRG